MAAGQEIRRNEELEERWRRAWRWALLASLVFHVLLVLLFWSVPDLPDVPVSAAGPRSGDPSAAAGGGSQMISFRIQLPPPTPEPIPKPPEPVPVPDPVTPVEPPQETTPTPVASDGQRQATGEAPGAAKGPGTATGTGRGDGGTGDEGLYRVTAPSPRGLILPPSDRPGKVRGKEVVVYVFVTDRGRVVSDSTRLDR